MGECRVTETDDIWRRLCVVFGDEASVNEWLTTANQLIGGKQPALASRDEILQILDILETGSST